MRPPRYVWRICRACERLSSWHGFCRPRSGRSGCHFSSQFVGVRHYLPCRHAGRWNSHASQSSVPRARNPLPDGKFRRSFPHHRRAVNRERESDRTPKSAPHLHHPQCRAKSARRRRAIFEPAPPIVGQTSSARSRLRANHRRASLLQRHYRTAQGRDALALQSGGERLSAHRSRRGHAYRRRRDALLPAALSHLRTHGRPHTLHRARGAARADAPL